jgi:hypothetical protein
MSEIESAMKPWVQATGTSALEFFRRVDVEKFEPGQRRRAGWQESEETRARCEKIDEHGPHARNCRRGAWKSNPNSI